MLVALVVFAAVLLRQFPMVDEALGVDVDAGMKPGAGLDRWHVEAGVVIGKAASSPWRPAPVNWSKIRYRIDPPGQTHETRARVHRNSRGDIYR